MDTSILEEIGLTNSEIKVYLALLELGQATRTPIYKKSGIASSKVYETLEKLISKGLVSFILENNVRMYRAASPYRIEDYLNEKKERIIKQEKILKKLVPQLESLKGFEREESNAEIYLGWRGMETIYTNLLRELNSEEEYYIFGASLGEDKLRVKRFFMKFNEKSLKKKLKVRIIFNENAKGNIPNIGKSKLQKVKYLKQTTPAEIVIYGNKTTIVLLQKKPLLIQITGQEITDSFKAYFEIMWHVAKE